MYAWIISITHQNGLIFSKRSMNHSSYHHGKYCEHLASKQMTVSLCTFLTHENNEMERAM